MTTASGFTPFSISRSAHAAPAVSVVVPTLNEAGNIGRLLEEVFAACGSRAATTCVNAQGSSLHAEVRLGINQRHKLESQGRRRLP